MDAQGYHPGRSLASFSGGNRGEGHFRALGPFLRPMEIFLMVSVIISVGSLTCVP
jgi:hypothetical protein